MNYKDKTRDQLLNELAELHQRIGDLEAKKPGRRQAEFVSNVYLVYNKKSIFIWDNNK